MFAPKTYRAGVIWLLIIGLIANSGIPANAGVLTARLDSSRRVPFSSQAVVAPLVHSVRRTSFDKPQSLRAIQVTANLQGQSGPFSTVSRESRRAKGFSEEEIDRLEIHLDSFWESWGLSLLIASGGFLLTAGIVGALDLAATSLAYLFWGAQWGVGFVAARLWIYNHPSERRDYHLRHSGLIVALAIHTAAMMWSAISIQYVVDGDPGLLTIMAAAFFGYGLNHWLLHWLINNLVEPKGRYSYGGLNGNLQPSPEFVFSRLEPGAAIVMPESYNLESLKITASRFRVEFIGSIVYGRELMVLSNSHFRRFVDTSKISDEEIRPMVGALNIYQRPGQVVILPVMKQSAFERLVTFADRNQIRVRYRGHAAGFHFQKSHVGVQKYEKRDPNIEFDQLKLIPKDLLEQMLLYVNGATEEKMKEDHISPRAIEGILDRRAAGLSFGTMTDLAFWFEARTASTRLSLQNLIKKLKKKFPDRPANTKKSRHLPGSKTIALLVVFLGTHYAAPGANHQVALRIAA